MHKNSDIIESFESVLKKKCNVKPLTLYKDTKISVRNHNHTLNAQSIISHVSNQIKVIQNAEAVKSDKRSVINMDKYRNSSFLPLNELRDRVPPRPPDPHKFDTQQFSNTQLINIVEDAEALDGNMGMTQEFETAFLCSQDDTDEHHKQNSEQKKQSFPILDISLKEPDSKLILTTSLMNYEVNQINDNSMKSNEELDFPAEIDTPINVCSQSNQAVDKYGDINVLEDIDAIEQDREKLDYLQAHSSQQNFSQKPPSPVFNVKSKKPMSQSESPLVFELELFEKFENIAMPIVENTLDTEQARILINSQIIGNEIVIHTYMEDTEPMSPIIEFNDVLRIDKESITEQKIEWSCIASKKATIENQDIQNIEESKSKENSQSDKSIYHDDILFSSDEEEAYHHRSYKDLPFTCALETSFYEETEDLDKTMYVGFQTASNKSIQIDTVSFCKAKSWLDTIEHDLNNEGTLTEMVKICDMMNSGSTDVNTLANIANTKPIDDIVDALDRINYPNSAEIPCNDNGSVKNMLVEDKNNSATTTLHSTLVGFKTASNNQIQPYKEPVAEASEKSKTILPSINLDSNMSENIGLHDVVNHDMIEEQSIDDDIIREFQEDLMHGELEEILKDVESADPIVKNKKIIDYGQSVGFKTASNKNINISDAAVAKSKKLFQDIDLTESFDTMKQSSDNFTKTISNIGFRTASNKSIIVSEEALIKTKLFFNGTDSNAGHIDIPLSENSHIKVSENEEGNKTVFEIENIFDKPNRAELKTDLTGFKTLDSTNLLLFESGNMEIYEKDEDREPPFLGFDKNDKYVEVVEETLEKSQKILEKLTTNGNASDLSNSTRLKQKNPNEFSNTNKDPMESLSELQILKQQFYNTPGISGFQTASNKEIKISDEALAMSRRMFLDITEYKLLTNPKGTLSDIKFKGFQTASNKDIKISDSALAKSKQIFEEISDSKYTNVNIDMDTKFKGFETASHKDVKISKEAFARSKKIFQYINDDTSADTNENNLNTKTTFKGFQTASNKQMRISEKALAQSRKLFQGISEDKLLHETNFNDVRSSKADVDLKFKGFHAASENQINVSEKALIDSQKLFEEIPDIGSVETSLDYLHEKSGKNTNKMLFEGFQTVNNKKISEVALAQSRKIFRNTTDESVATNTNSLCGVTATSSTFQGFKTASNKEVEISAEALARSKKIFEDVNENKDVESNSNVLNTINKDLSSKFEGFQTANNKQVKISADALANSKKISQDMDDDQPQNVDFCTRSSPMFSGFQTASNKEVKISAEALARSKQIFDDINDNKYVESNPNVLNTINKDLSSKFEGFQTANNKQMKISADALANSKRIFQDIIDNDQPQKADLGRTSPIFRGFQTASNKEVKLSEEAIAKSRKLFQEIEDVEIGPKNNKANFRGFQTASNKNVKISEEAIADSRKIFQDLNLNTDNTGAFKSKISEVAYYSKLTGFETASHNKVDLSEDALTKSRNLFSDNIAADIKMQFKQQADISKKCAENINDVDTQLLNNFEESMHEVTPKKSKRSGSPILSCPKTKKRKIFQIPYSQKSPKKSSETFKPPHVIQKSENAYNFSMSYKKVKIFSLKDLKRLEESASGHTNIDPYIQRFDFENLLEFEFIDSRNDVTKSVFTLSEVKNIFLNSVNKKLVPEGWLDIQLKLILWKLISYEIKFPKTMLLVCTAKNVLEQLKFRYDKELYNAERPALRKIFENDDTAAKTLIFCVVAVCEGQDASQPPELLLTDGWYIIKAVIDKMLAKLVGNGKIAVGTKLVTNGAELVGSEQAVSPWESTSAIRLKIFGNSTRRARWDSRLGYHGNAAILTQLSTVSMDGGKVSKLRVFVTRVYPPLYVDKFEDGSTVTRSERLEHLHQMKFESERQALLEKVYEEVEKEVLDQNSQDFEGDTEGCGKRKCLDSGSQIAKVMKRSRDPAEFRSHLTSTQMDLLEDHTAKEREKLLQEIQARVQNKMAALGATLNRNVVTLFKVRVAGVEEKRGGVEVTRALLSIWRPNEAVLEMIKEGAWIEILNVVPTALRYSELQISAGRQSIFSQSKFKESDKIKRLTESLKRICYPIKDLVKNPTMTTDHNEIDTVGMIFEIDPAMNNFDLHKHQFQNVFLADAEKNIVSVNFWGGLKKFGFENVLDTGQIVAGTNLQKRAGNSRKNIPQYRVTEFSFFTKTPKSETARTIIEELEQKLLKIDNKVFCQECVHLKINFFKKTNENVTPYRFPNMDISLSKNKIFIDSPVAQNTNKKDENLNLTGLDFDSTFKETEQYLSPKTLLRKRQVKEKIEKLKWYGEPPPLSPMRIINKSKNAANAFKSPLISKPDVSSSVTSNEKKLPKNEKCDESDDAIQCSPVINLNRIYVKRSNPVKLNFSKNDSSLSEVVDEFAEEFDCSPPLSLD